MEALDLTSRITAVLQLSAQVLERLSDAESTSHDGTGVALQISKVHTSLLNLKVRIHEGTSDEPWYEAVRALVAEDSPLHQYQQALARFQTGMMEPTEVDCMLAHMVQLKTVVEIASEMDYSSKLSQAIQDITRATPSLLQDTQSDVDMLEVDSDMEGFSELLGCISTKDYRPQYSDIIRRKQEGTGKWFLNDPMFHQWLNAPRATLYCPGVPGAGKTMIAATVVEHLLREKRDDSCGVAYVFCNHKDHRNQSPPLTLAAIVRQLTDIRLPQSLKPVKRMYYRYINRRQGINHIEEARPLLSELLEHYSTFYLVIDALDEYSKTSSQPEELLFELKCLQQRHDIRLMVTSRLAPGIEESLQEPLKLEIRASEEDIKRFVSSQIGRLPKCVERDPSLQAWVKESITETSNETFLLARLYTDTLLDKSTVKGIRSTLSKFSTESDTLDHAYSYAIDRIERQPEAELVLAKNALSLITQAPRTLTVDEICCALAIEPGDKELNPGNIPHVEDITAVCAGIVIVDEECAVVRLIHHSAQEYFDHDGPGWTSYAQEHVARTCLTCLSFDVFKENLSPTVESVALRIHKNKFLYYAAEHWASHVEAVQDKVSQLACAFLGDANLIKNSEEVIVVGSCCPNPPFLSSSARLFPPSLKNQKTSSLHIAAKFGLSRVIEIMLSRAHGGQSIDIDMEDGEQKTPIHLAAYHKRFDIIRLLIRKGANINLTADQSLLCKVCRDDQYELAEMLLNAGVEIVPHGVKLSMLDMSKRNALAAAVELRRERIVQLLLSRGADATIIDSDSSTIVHHALGLSHHCSASLIRPLLDHGVPLNTVNGYNMTPLLYCVAFAHESVAELLLEREVPVNSGVIRGDRRHSASGPMNIAPKVGAGHMPLHYAALDLNSDPAIAELLLQHGANPNAITEDGQSPLQIVNAGLREAVNDHWNLSDEAWEHLKDEHDTGISNKLAIYDLLLAQPGVDTEVKDPENNTLVHQIWFRRRDGVQFLQKLLPKGMDLSCRNSDGRTALHMACSVGDHESVRVLMDLGLDATLADNFGINCLHHAARSKDHKTLEMILASEEASIANLVATRNAEGSNALHLLLSSEFDYKGTGCWNLEILNRDAKIHAETVKMLIDNGVDGMQFNELGWLPLELYLRRGGDDISVYRLLLDLPGADGYINNGKSNLGHLYAEASHLDEDEDEDLVLTFADVLNILTEYGFDMNERNSGGETVFHTILRHQGLGVTEELFDFFLQIGISADMEDAFRQVALRYAKDGDQSISPDDSPRKTITKCFRTFTWDGRSEFMSRLREAAAKCKQDSDSSVESDSSDSPDS